MLMSYVVKAIALGCKVAACPANLEASRQMLIQVSPDTLSVCMLAFGLCQSCDALVLVHY